MAAAQESRSRSVGLYSGLVRDWAQGHEEARDLVRRDRGGVQDLWLVR
jgi:hypothetical protein